MITAQKVFTEAEKRATRQKIGSAGLALVSSSPHFGLAWAKMRPIAKVPAVTQGGTWEVDRKGVMYADPAFTATLSDGEAQFILGHEILHILGDHFGRSVALGLRQADGYTVNGQEQNLEVWAWATDMVINYALVTDGVGQCPKTALVLPSEYITSGFRKDAESVYYWLLKNPQHGPQGGGQGQPKNGQGSGQKGQKGAGGAPAPGAGCQPLPAPGDGAGEAGKGPEGLTAPGQGPAGSGIDWKLIRAEMEATARAVGKFAGKGSAVADLLAPEPSRTDWRKLIRQGAESASSEAEERSRRTYSRLARRPDDGSSIVRPGRIGTEGTLAVVCDISGSIDRDMVKKMAGHVFKMAQQFPTVRIIFVTHTDRVEYSRVLTRQAQGDKDQVLKGLARTGGTRVAPAYEEVLKLNKGKKVDNVVHFTDCYIERPWPEPPGKHLTVGIVGSGDGGTPFPEKARSILIDTK